MKLVAIEEHFLTQDVRGAWEQAAVIDDSARLNSGWVGERLDDLGEERLRLMDETGVDVQAKPRAAHGFVTVVFDASCQGASDGEPRLLEDATTRVRRCWRESSYHLHNPRRRA